MGELNAAQYKSFESIKYTDEFGSEYCLTREFAPALEYVQWRNFARVLEPAMWLCKNSGHDVQSKFVETGIAWKCPSSREKIMKRKEK
jgi:DNA-damage-inducible protein D